MRIIDCVACVIGLSFFGCSSGAPDPSTEGGASVASQDEALRRLCDGSLKLSCPKAQYCNVLSAGHCPGARTFGVCAAEPQLCSDLFAPVCGCDGQTYPNACFAAAAGVAVEQQGACTPTKVSCGGIAGIACPGFGRCVDDPTDNCDPAAGGADCGGICSCIDNVACKLGTHFDGNPKICTCVSDAAAQ